MSIVPSDPHPTMPAEPAKPDDQPVPDDASISSSTRSAVLSEAVEACDLTAAPGINLADEGRSIAFDMKGEEDNSGADFPYIACLFTELDMTSAVLSHIDQTTSMDGRQTETWKTLSYHPDRGLDGVLTVTDD